MVGSLSAVFRKRPGNLCTLTLTGANRHFNCCAVLTVFALFLRTGFNFATTAASAVFTDFLTKICFVPLVKNVLTSGFNCNGVIAANVIVVFTNCILLTVPVTAGVKLCSVFNTLTLVTLKAKLFGKGLRMVMNGLCSTPRCDTGHSATFDLFCVTVGVNTLFTPATTATVAGCILNGTNFDCMPRVPSLTRRFLSNAVATRNRTALATVRATRGFAKDVTSFYAACVSGLSRTCGCNFNITYVSLVTSVTVCIVFHSAFGRTSCGSGRTGPTGMRRRRLAPTRAGRHVITLLLMFTIIVFF